MRSLASIVHSALFGAKDWQESLLQAYKHIPNDPEVKAIKRRVAEYNYALEYYNKSGQTRGDINGAQVKQVRRSKLGR